MLKEQILKKAVTPAYIFSLDELEDRVRLIRKILGDRIRIVFAVKANPFLVETLSPLVDGFEACSPGEDRICRALNVPSDKMVISGVNKEEASVAEQVRFHKEKAVYTVESPLQMALLNKAALKAGCRINVLLRLSSGNQFGMDEKTLKELLGRREDYTKVRVRGLQFFSGTQKKSRRISQEIAAADELLTALHASGASGTDCLQEFEFGPGLPVSYFPSDKETPDEVLLESLREDLDAMRYRGQITLEIGRFLAAHCGYYLTEVSDLKETGETGYCIVDGGIHQLNYYGQMMGMKIPHLSLLRKEGGITPLPEGAEANDHRTVCGSLCTTADVLIRDLPVSGLKGGDVLVFERAGAYSVTEGISLFLSRDLPRVYLTKQDTIIEVRKQVLTEELNYGRINPDS